MRGKFISRLELELLGRCLSLHSTPEETESLALELRECGYARILDLALQLRLEVSLALAMKSRSLLPPIPKMTLPDGRVTITKSIDDLLVAHSHRRAAMKDRLVEIIITLNQAGIMPTLIKGARSLWTGSPEWRSLRDLDILIEETDARRAQALLHQMGYVKLKRTYIHFGKHHLPELFRPDLPGWVELHRKIAVRFAEQLLPTAELVRRQEIVSSASGAKVGLLQNTDHILQSLLHHHFHHDQFRNKGWLNVKGLYEFATDLAGLDEIGRQELSDKACTHPRLLAALDLWLAAASDLFGCPILEPLKVLPDAALHWSKAKHRMTSMRRFPLPYPGHFEEISLCFERARLQRVKSSGSFLGRLRARMRVLTSLANNSYPNTIVLPRRWL